MQQNFVEFELVTIEVTTTRLVLCKSVPQNEELMQRRDEY